MAHHQALAQEIEAIIRARFLGGIVPSPTSDPRIDWEVMPQSGALTLRGRRRKH